MADFAPLLSDEPGLADHLPAFESPDQEVPLRHGA
jgi:hypothetical protein